MPKRSDTGGAAGTSYSFVGEVDLGSTDLRDIAGLLDSFSEWAVKHSRKRHDAGPVEDTLAFKAMSRLLPKVS